eukprot:6205121-Pleurochrysis_carterae.AAC.2
MREEGERQTHIKAAAALASSLGNIGYVGRASCPAKQSNSDPQIPHDHALRCLHRRSVCDAQHTRPKRTRADAALS